MGIQDFRSLSSLGEFLDACILGSMILKFFSNLIDSIILIKLPHLLFTV